MGLGAFECLVPLPNNKLHLVAIVVPDRGLETSCSSIDFLVGMTGLEQGRVGETSAQVRPPPDPAFLTYVSNPA